MKPPRRLMLVDAASLYFRAFHGVPQSMTAPDGTPVNAVRGLLDMLATLVSTRRPDDLVACWDEDWRPAFRVAAIPSYKAHRLARPGGAEEIVPDALVPQVDILIDVLAALGVARVGAAGYEADDVLGTLATRAAADASAAGEVADVEVVSGDRDLFQLVDDAAGVRVLYVGRGVRNLETVDQTWLRARHAVPTGAAYADMAVLRGDTSDGLPGVPGIGDKTAAGLITRFGSLDALLDAVASGDGSIAPGQRRKLVDAAAYLAAAPAVVRVVRDIDLPRVDAALPREPADPEHLLALVERWGIGSSVQRFLQAVGWTGDSA